MAAARRAAVLSLIRLETPRFDEKAQVPRHAQKIFRELYTAHKDFGADVSQEFFEWAVDLSMWASVFTEEHPFTWESPDGPDLPPFCVAYQQYFAKMERDEARASETESQRRALQSVPQPAVQPTPTPTQPAPAQSVPTRATNVHSSGPEAAVMGHVRSGLASSQARRENGSRVAMTPVGRADPGQQPTQQLTRAQWDARPRGLGYRDAEDRRRHQALQSLVSDGDNRAGQPSRELGDAASDSDEAKLVANDMSNL